MDKRNRAALAYLLAGISAAGRALLAMPESTQLQELSLTALAVVGYLLLCRRTVWPLVCGGGQLVLELVLCGSQNGGVWVWLNPALRAVDLWLLLGASVLMLGVAGQPRRAMPVAASSRRSTRETSTPTEARFSQSLFPWESAPTAPSMAAFPPSLPMA